ncbi:hypothetical protein V498_09312, partial [Pseudogymnoascus sp. VKM F-4517 (FW-2822)]
VGDTSVGPASSIPIERKALPSASRVVSGDIPLYVASPSRKGGSSRKLFSDRAPEPQPGLPSPALERANPTRAAIFPSPRRQPNKALFIDAGPDTPPQEPRSSPAVSTGRSGDNGKGSRGNALMNESARRSPDRLNHDPFGPIPRRRPASPPKIVNTPRPADTHSAVGAPQLEESTPVREKNAEPEAGRTEQHTPGVVPSGVEAETRGLESSNDTIVHHSIAESLTEALPAADHPRVPKSFFRHSARRPTRRTSYSDLIPVSFDESSPDPPPVAPKPEGYRPGQAYQAHRLDERTPPLRAEAPPDGNIAADRPLEPRDPGRGDEQESQGDSNKGRRQGSVHHHHHHYHTHYWVRSGSAPAGSDGRKLRRETTFNPETADVVEQDPSPTSGVVPERARPPSEWSVPTAGNRERYIVGGGSGSDTDEEAYSKVVSETLARVRKRGREEHTHIHIYVPQQPAVSQPVVPQPVVPQPAVNQPAVPQGRSGRSSRGAERGEGGTPERGPVAESRSRSAGAKSRNRSRWGRSGGEYRGRRLGNE